MSADQPDPLEKPIDAVLRSLPERAAPASLEQRVLMELEARPWWRQPYARWPQLARGSVVAISAGMTAIMAMLSVEFFRGPGTEFAARLGERFHEAWVTGRVLFELGQSLIGLVPPLWLFGGVGLLACIYGTLFGLGAAAYRLLWKTSGTLSS